jgi:putative membrane protein
MLTTLKIRREEMLFLIEIVVGLVIGIFGFSALIDLSLSTVPSLMYGIFSGLVIGGVPVVFKRIEKLGISALLSLAAGVAIVVLISILSSRTGGVALTDHGAINLVYDVVAGFFGASAMVLPGLSGAFILLVMGEYTRAISAIKSFDLVIIAFIGVGVILGVLFVSRLLKYLMKEFRSVTFAFLLGLMIGSIPDLITRPGKNTDLTLIVSGVILGIFVSYLLTLLEKRNNIQV